MFAKPAVKNKVRVTTQFPNTCLIVPGKFKINVHEGEVVNSFRGDPPNTFRLLTNNPNHPMPRISLDYVIDLVGLSGKVTPAANDIKAYEVKGSGGQMYTVTFANRKWGCTCPGFSYRKNCSHIQKIQLEEHEALHSGLKMVVQR